MVLLLPALFWLSPGPIFEEIGPWPAGLLRWGARMGARFDPYCTASGHAWSGAGRCSRGTEPGCGQRICTSPHPGNPAGTHRSGESHSPWHSQRLSVIGSRVRWVGTANGWGEPWFSPRRTPANTVQLGQADGIAQSLVGRSGVRKRGAKTGTTAPMIDTRGIAPCRSDVATKPRTPWDHGQAMGSLAFERPGRNRTSARG